MNLLRAAATVSGLTLLSRVTGLVRDMALARAFGASAEMDAFNVAFRLPNLLRRVFAEGAFSQAFVPLFSGAYAKEGEAASKALLSQVTSALFWVLLAVCVLGVLGAPVLVWAMASGFAEHPDRFALATELTRWMFPYILFMSMVAALAAALNTFKRFAVPAFTPVLLNLSFIGAVLLLAPHLSSPIFALAVAVLVGGALQLTVQFVAVARMGWAPRLVSPWAAFRSEGVQRVLRQMLPALFGVSVAQLSLIINTNIASHLAAGSVSWVTYADRLMELPTALLGVAVGTVLLPGMSGAFAQNDMPRYRALIDWGLRLTLLIALPATLGLALLGHEVVSVLFQGHRFSAFDVQQTAHALLGYCVGLVGLIAVKVLAPAYYARGNLATPVKVAVVALVVTQLANLVLVPRFAHAGLTAAISVGALVNAGLLYWGLRKAALAGGLSGWSVFLAKLVLALAVLVAVVLAGQTFGPDSAMLSTLMRALWLAAQVGAAAGAYFAVLWALGVRARDFMVHSA